MSDEENSATHKSYRVLSIIDRLKRGESVSRPQLSVDFSVSEKTIQRDVDDIKAFLQEKEFSDVKYDAIRHGYVLVNKPENQMSNQEIFAICKILIESRAFNKVEFSELYKKITNLSSAFDRAKIHDLLANECFNYIPLKHGKPLLDLIWQIGDYIKQQHYIEFDYQRQDKTSKSYIVKPVGLVFSEFYFYLVAYIKDLDKPFPAIFRLDRIDNPSQKRDRFSIDENERFKEGEFKNHTQFMYSGHMTTIRFKFHGSSIDAVFDKLPTARYPDPINQPDLIEAEVYGTGIKMWLLSQREYVEVIRPKEFREEMAQIVENMYQIYHNEK